MVEHLLAKERVESSNLFIRLHGSVCFAGLLEESSLLYMSPFPAIQKALTVAALALHFVHDSDLCSPIRLSASLMRPSSLAIGKFRKSF